MKFRLLGATLLSMLAAVETAEAGTLQVTYADDWVSVQVEQVPVKTVLQEIARQAGFKLYMAEGAGEAPGSWTLRRIALEEALAKLVRPDGLAIFYEPAREQGQPPRITALHVLPPGVESTADAEPHSLLFQDTESEAQRLSLLVTEPGDIETRRQAITDLAALGRADATRGLEAALGVREPALRQEVVHALGETYRDAPPTALGQVVMGDADAQVRRAAVLALSGLGGEVARLFLEHALKDKDEAVRAAATQALRH